MKTFFSFIISAMNYWNFFFSLSLKLPIAPVFKFYRRFISSATDVLGSALVINKEVALRI